jgi:hypothetical protein
MEQGEDLQDYASLNQYLMLVGYSTGEEDDEKEEDLSGKLTTVLCVSRHLSLVEHTKHSSYTRPTMKPNMCPLQKAAFVVKKS